MGEQMHRHIYEMNLSWGQMLDFYTDLNNARKEKDDKYVEDQFIGEEIIEPDEHAMPFATESKQSADDDDTGNLLGALKEEIKQEEQSMLMEEDVLLQPAKLTIKTAEIIEQ